MGKEQIINKLDELYKESKSRNFINHLVRAYFPKEKIKQVTNTPSDKNFKCALSSVTLIALNDAMSNIDNESQQRVIEYLDNSLSKSIEVTELKFEDGRELSVRGTESNTFMSVDAYCVFHDWVLGKFLNGDKHISWLLKDVNKRDYINNGKSGKVNKPKRTESKPKRATYTLGDMGVLQELYKKLNNGQAN